MKQIAVRLSPASLAQLAELVEWRGETQSLVMRVALDRLHQEEQAKHTQTWRDSRAEWLEEHPE
jgi:hypothetical protein